VIQDHSPEPSSSIEEHRIDIGISGTDDQRGIRYLPAPSLEAGSICQLFRLKWPAAPTPTAGLHDTNEFASQIPRSISNLVKYN
jgi:hypothetical protein